jgi:hypothetical protein
VPASFRWIKSQLHLAIVTLQRVEEQARSGRISDADAQALRPVVDSSLDETKQLTTFLGRAVPAGTYSNNVFGEHSAMLTVAYPETIDFVCRKCGSTIVGNDRVLSIHILVKKRSRSS